MEPKIRLGICGYGNLGAGIESEIPKNPDMELAAIFTRRAPSQLRRADTGVPNVTADTGVPNVTADTGVPIVSADAAADWKGAIDVMILCGGSANDLPVQGVAFAKMFNTVDSYDTHAKIPEYFKSIDEAARSGNNISIISAGWDPGLFSLMRLYLGAIIPCGETYSFWGKGVSQGHSGAIRTIEGVEGAVQYSLPNFEAMDAIRRGENPALTTRQKHQRLCYVVAAPGADTRRIENEIKAMPHYFADYETTVHFISGETLKNEHGKLPHGGNVIRSGVTGRDNKQLMELSLKLDSNPEFTSSVMLACARAAYRLSQKGETGARTALDIPPALLSPLSHDDLLKDLL